MCSARGSTAWRCPSLAATPRRAGSPPPPALTLISGQAAITELVICHVLGSVPRLSPAPSERGGGQSPLAQQVPTAAGARHSPPAAEICITEQVHEGERISGLLLPLPPARRPPPPPPPPSRSEPDPGPVDRPSPSWERRPVFAVTGARLPVKHRRSACSADSGAPGRCGQSAPYKWRKLSTRTAVKGKRSRGLAQGDRSPWRSRGMRGTRKRQAQLSRRAYVMTSINVLALPDPDATGLNLDSTQLVSTRSLDKLRVHLALAAGAR